MKTILFAIVTLGLLLAPTSRLSACDDPPNNTGGEAAKKTAPTPSPTPTKPDK